MEYNLYSVRIDNGQDRYILGRDVQDVIGTIEGVEKVEVEVYGVVLSEGVEKDLFNKK